MAEGSEMRGFVFCVVYIIMFTALITTIPTGFLGAGGTASDIVAIDPNVLTGFTESENYTPAAYSAIGPATQYEYILGDNTFINQKLADTFTLGAKVLYLGILWLGVMDYCIFSTGDTIRGTSINYTNIETDAPDGIVTYDLTFSDAGVSAGSLIIYWNITAYPSFSNAWTAEEVYLLHGIGFAESATNNAGALLIGLLTLSIPDVPVLIQIMVISPLWASIAYIVWFIVKEMIPFL